MTLTRKYFDSLIGLLSSLCSLNENEPLAFSDIKNDLSHIISRISKFNLFPLTFSNEFEVVLHQKVKSDFDNQRSILINELHFELHECLYTTRLRYGGELMFYLFELKLAILKLQIPQLKQLETILKLPNHYYLRTNLPLKTEGDKLKQISISKAEQRNNKVIKQKIRIAKKDYLKVESKLKEYYHTYQQYILTNYPVIAHHFPFHNKKLRAYITEAISKDVFEFRIHAYQTNSKNPSVNLVHQYYDFYPAYFFNLEEISDIQTGATVLLLNKKDFLFPNPFPPESIFRELINIYLENSNEVDIINFTKFLLQCQFYKFSDIPQKLNAGFDLFAEKANAKYLYEIYHHKTRSSDKIFQRISELRSSIPSYNISFVFSSYPGKSIIELLSQSNIKPIYLSDLISIITSVNNTQIIEWFIKDKLKNFKALKKSTKSFEGVMLIKRLEDCPTGEKNWTEFETIGIDIFRFLFEDTFRSYIAEEQFSNDLKNHRRDLIVSNYYKDSTSFWAECKQLYKSQAIIVDFKNYSDKLNSTTLFSVQNIRRKK